MFHEVIRECEEGGEIEDYFNKTTFLHAKIHNIAQAPTTAESGKIFSGSTKAMWMAPKMKKR